MSVFNQENGLETVSSKVQELLHLSAGTKMKQVRHLPWRQNIRGTKNFSNQEKYFNATFKRIK